MILVDSRIGSKELLPLIQRQGVKAELTQLPFGDFAFEGHGPEGTIAVGIERKTLHEMLARIEDSHYSAHQKVGMAQLYNVSILALEGMWQCGTSPELGGMLVQGFNGGASWGPCKYRAMATRYSKLFRYLLSLSLSKVTVLLSANPEQTAINVVECFHYFQKDWSSHTSMLETETLNLPSLTGKPSLVRRWAADLEGIGVKHSTAAEQRFRVPIILAAADVEDWASIPGIGGKTAQSIIKEIRG